MRPVVHGECVIAKALEDLVSGNSVRCTSVLKENHALQTLWRSLQNLGIAVEEDEDGVLGGETSNSQSTQIPSITVIPSEGQKCAKKSVDCSWTKLSSKI